MVTKAQDTFTEVSKTELENHTPDTGTGWTVSTVEVWFVDNVADNLELDNTFLNMAREDTDIGDDDMDVSVKLVAVNAIDGNNTSAGVAGRIPSGTVNISNHYRAEANTVTDVALKFELFKVVAGTETSLGEHADDPAANDVLKLEIRTGTKKLFVNSVEKISSTDDSLTGNNFAGLAGLNEKEYLCDDFLSEDVAAGGQTFTGAQTLANYEQAGSAVEIFTASAVQALGDYLQAGVGAHPHSLSGVQTLSNYLQSGSLTQIFITTGEMTLAELQQSGVVLMLPSGSGVQTLADYLQAASATHTENVSIAGAQALPEYLQAGMAVMIQPEGSGAQTLAEYLQAGAVVQFFSAAGAQALANYLQATSGSEVIIGAGTSVLAEILQTGAAVMAPSGLGGQVLSEYAQAGLGVKIFIAGGNQTLSNLTQAANSGIRFDGVSAQTLADYVQDGNGVQVFIGAGAQTLAALAQAGAGVVVLTGPTFVAEFIAILTGRGAAITTKSSADIALAGTESVGILQGGDVSVKGAPRVIISTGGDVGI